MVGILLSYWGGLFSGAMLVSGRVMVFYGKNSYNIQTNPGFYGGYGSEIRQTPGKANTKLNQFRISEAVSKEITQNFQKGNVI